MRASFLRGISLVEVIVGISLMLIVFLSLLGMLRASIQLASLAKLKAVAAELASTQMETLRGTAYSALGTVGGNPSGTIARNATSTINGIPFGIETVIVYVDDAADGTGASDANHLTNDYKKVSVTTRYTANGHTGSVVLVSNFAPPDIETP